jgi:hypothetical protein
MGKERGLKKTKTPGLAVGPGTGEKEQGGVILWSLYQKASFKKSD